MLEEIKEPYVFPKNCNQVLFYPYVLDEYWWFILRQKHKSKHVFKNNSVSMPIEEDNVGDGNGN